jgi:hypothetical protein
MFRGFDTVMRPNGFIWTDRVHRSNRTDPQRDGTEEDFDWNGQILRRVGYTLFMILAMWNAKVVLTEMGLAVKTFQVGLRDRVCQRMLTFWLTFARLSVALMHVTDHKEFTDYSTKVMGTDQTNPIAIVVTWQDNRKNLYEISADSH